MLQWSFKYSFLLDVPNKNKQKEGPTPTSFCLFSFLFRQQFYRKILDFSGIWTWIVGVEGEHANHFTTTTTAKNS